MTAPLLVIMPKSRSLSLLFPLQQWKKELVKSLSINSWSLAEKGSHEDGVPFGSDSFSQIAGGGVGCQNISFSISKTGRGAAARGLM